MHEFRRFIQNELDARGWKQADLVRASGLSRSHVSKLLRDHREHLGQMPDDSTIAALAKGFGLPMEVIQTAASRALAGYSDNDAPLQIDLRTVSTEALLREVERRSATAEAMLAKLIHHLAPDAPGDLRRYNFDIAWSEQVTRILNSTVAATSRQEVATDEELNENSPRKRTSGTAEYSSRVQTLLGRGRQELESYTRSARTQHT
ncbi:helix-turn-helix transcriptional regulator [Nocardia abscessus]|uniref:helix-turn-helix domain-containing protein n=1 Tax=Nocardia abscessus TaxID=120957 RepID=UPI001895303C|nr:helix-turn-helix transcriptional regulator [Nocardia abscessus]MBF6340670.1 helix-turn-helix transcriptional regulator [Nocardia abscessus]